MKKSQLFHPISLQITSIWPKEWSPSDHWHFHNQCSSEYALVAIAYEMLHSFRLLLDFRLKNIHLYLQYIRVENEIQTFREFLTAYPKICTYGKINYNIGLCLLRNQFSNMTVTNWCQSKGNMTISDISWHTFRGTKVRNCEISRLSDSNAHVARKALSTNGLRRIFAAIYEKVKVSRGSTRKYW